MVLLVFLYLLALSLWIGKMLYFTLVDGPTIHRTLERDVARPLVRAILPKYYTYGLICGGLGILTNMGLLASGRYEITPLWIQAVLLGIMLFLTAYARFMLLPVLNSLNPPTDGPANNPVTERHAALHRVALVINVLVLVLGVVTLYLFTMVLLQPPANA